MTLIVNFVKCYVVPILQNTKNATNCKRYLCIYDIKHFTQNALIIIYNIIFKSIFYQK